MAPKCSATRLKCSTSGSVAISSSSRVAQQPTACTTLKSPLDFAKFSGKSEKSRTRSWSREARLAARWVRWVRLGVALHEKRKEGSEQRCGPGSGKHRFRALALLCKYHSVLQIAFRRTVFLLRVLGILFFLNWHFSLLNFSSCYDSVNQSYLK